MPENKPQDFNQLKQDTIVIQPWMYRKWQEFPALTFLFLFVILVSVAVGIFTELLLYWIGGIFLFIFNMYLMNSDFKSSALLLNKDQFPRIYEIFEKICIRMGANAKNIRLYITFSPVYNAFAFGVFQKSIVLHSSIVDDFTDKEIEVILAHELAHIMAGHTVVLSFLPQANLPFLDLFFGFYSRNTEYTCDRAAVAVTKDVTACVTAMLKLVAGAKVSKSIDYSTFGEQIKSVQYDLGVFLAELSASHPMPLKRIKATLNFAKNHLEKKI